MNDAISMVSTLLDAHNRRDTDLLAAHYAPGATVHMAEGREPIAASEWIEAVGYIAESFPDLTFATGRIAAVDATVMFEILITGTNNGPLYLNDTDRLILQTDALTLPPTGGSMRIDGVVVLDMADGLITTERHFLHLAGTLEQLGLVGPSKASAASNA